MEDSPENINYHFDVAILGSGMGGLVCANILSKEGFKVLVLEKNNQFGGSLQTFSRDKKLFDTGVHYIGGLAKGQNLYKYFTYLGIAESLELSQLNVSGFDKVTFDNDPIEYPYSQGKENFIHDLLQYFPDEEKAITGYYEKMENICNSFPMYKLSADKPEDIENTIALCASKEIDKITQNPLLRAVLAGTNFLYAGEKNKTPFYVHSLSVFSFIESAWKCEKGGSQISKLMVKEIRKHHGLVLKGKEIKELLVNDNKIEKIITTTNETFCADKIISNIDPKSTMNLLKGAKFRKNYVNRIKSAEDTKSSFSLYLVLKPKSLYYANHNIYHFKSQDFVWNSMDYNQENWPKCYMVSMTKDQNSPEFADTLTVLTYMNYEEVEAWSDTKHTVYDHVERGDSYEKFKELKAEKLIDELEKRWPNIRACIASYYCSTPLTYRDYIGTQTGGMYGFAKDYHQPLKAYMPIKSKIENLFFTGQSINMHGILGVTISGVLTCSEIIGKEYLLDKINASSN